MMRLLLWLISSKVPRSYINGVSYPKYTVYYTHTKQIPLPLFSVCRSMASVLKLCKIVISYWAAVQNVFEHVDN
jgi:hypothetical protein